MWAKSKDIKKRFEVFSKAVASLPPRSLLTSSGICLATVVGFSLSAVADDDACSTTALYAYADVTASDGKKYSVESFYRSKDRAASRFIREDGGSLHVVEGPFTWVQADGKAELAGNFQRDFALGHQFHALLLHFRAIMTDIEPVTDIEFAGGSVSALRGTRSTGGAAYLIDGGSSDQPAGMRFDVGDLKIDIIASDWRRVGGRPVPFALLIDDGTRTFDYRYKIVDLADRQPTWFYDNVTAPDLDAVKILRLHKKSLAAHCLGDADMMASLAASSPVIANGGSVFETSPEQMQSMFTNVFERRKYSNYIATRYPIIEVSASGDIGWASVQVNAKGVTEATGQPFDEHWAWFMLAKKIDGQWRMAGNSSNRQP